MSKDIGHPLNTILPKTAYYHLRKQCSIILSLTQIL